MKLLHKGKVKEVYAFGPDKLLFNFTDQISVFDKIIPTLVPKKGEALCRTSAYWFEETKSLGIDTHFIGLQDVDKMLVKRLEILHDSTKITPRMVNFFIPLEVVARHYLAGSMHDRVKAGVAQGDSGLPDVLARTLSEGIAITAVKSDHLWVDAVYPWDLLRVQAEVFRHQRPATAVVPNAHVEDGVLLGDDVTVGAYTVLGKGTTIGNHVVIGAHCVLENCIVEDDAQIGAGSILKNTIIAAGAIIGPRFTATSGPCETRTVDGYHHLADFGGVVGQDARIEAGVTLAPGVIVGNRVRVALGKTLTTSVEDGAQVL